MSLDTDLRGAGRMAARVAGFGTSIFSEMSALARSHGAVNLSQGFPDFPSPEWIRAAAEQAIAADLNQYAATMHFVGQSTIFTLNDDRATGEAYCIAHHLTVDSDVRRLMVAYLRYLDTFAKIDGTWLFVERLLYVDWLEQRVLS